MKKVNITKTRIVIFESLFPCPYCKNLISSINYDYFELTALIDNESGTTAPPNSTDSL